MASSDQTPALPPATNSLAQKALLAGLVLCFFGMFGKFDAGAQHTYIAGPVENAWSTQRITQTGWEMHPHAIYVLIGLAIVFLSPLRLNPFCRRFGYWIASVLLAFYVILPGFLVLAGGVLALIAAFLSIGEAKTASAPAA